MIYRFFTLSLVAVAAVGCNSAPQNATSGGGVPSGNRAASAGSSPAKFATPAAPTPRAFVRGVHVVPGAQPVSLQVNGRKVGGGFGFGNASQYVAIEPGRKVEISAIGAANNKLSGPMPVDLESGDDLTVMVNGIPGDVALLPFKGKSGGPQAGQAKIAFAHAAKGLNPIEISIDGARFRGGVEYGVATDYKVLPPGRHKLVVSYDRPSAVAAAPTPTLVPNQISAQPTPARPREQVTLQQEAPLDAGKVYTLVVFYTAGKQPRVRLLEDRFADTLQYAPKN